jgi:hypothetical protein
MLDVKNRWWQAARILVIALVVAGCALSWWGNPRKSTFEQARADIAAGSMIEYQWGESWSGTGLGSWFDSYSLKQTPVWGPIYAWRTADRKVHWIDTSEVQVTNPQQRAGYTDPAAAEIGVQLLQTGSADKEFVGVARSSTWVYGAGFGLLLLMVAALLSKNRPVRGTRWYWFFVVLAVPYGLGLVYWSLTDRPWNASAAERDNRRRGWVGLVTGLVAAIALTALVYGLNLLLGDRWVPQPGL